MAGPQLPKLATRVRFPSSAPKNSCKIIWFCNYFFTFQSILFTWRDGKARALPRRIKAASSTWLLTGKTLYFFTVLLTGCGSYCKPPLFHLKYATSRSTQAP